jgi:hypothetical protein
MTDIERACEKVYEAITGKCAHLNHSIIHGRSIFCKPCDKFVDNVYLPPLFDSIDAWMKYIFPCMNNQQKNAHRHCLHSVMRNKHGVWEYLATPLHHLEAALRMLGEDELAEKVREVSQ